ncbi:MAG TPA: hypothetical protein VM389_10495, partial [Phycisphaerae bacterium]|nr:hypothetical protein [Phycisphaerae bacterium]
KERNGRLVATYNPETLAAIAEVLSLISQVPKAPPPDKVEKAMMGTAKEADFDGKPLTDVMKSLRTAHDLNIHVNWRALGSVGVKPETPVTVHLRNAKLAAVIRKVLDVASPDQPLDYVVDGGVVIISRRADLDTQFVTRVYNIRRMLPTDARRAKAIDKIATTITGTIAPETWKIAFMSEINGLLLVTNCPRAHAGIAELLKQMSQRK